MREGPHWPSLEHTLKLNGFSNLHCRKEASARRAQPPIGTNLHMPTAAPLDLSNLYRHSVFRSRCGNESHRAVRTAITGHELRWGRGEVSTTLYKQQLSRISLIALKYGAEVEIRPELFDGFALVQMPLQGTFDVECDGTALEVRPGDIAVLTPRHDLRLLWHPQCEQLILKIPLSLMEQSPCPCSPVHPFNQDGPPACRLNSAFKLESHFHMPWRFMVQQLVSLLPGKPGHGVQLDWLEHLEKTVALFLIGHQPSSPPYCPAGIAQECPLPATASSPILDRLGQVEAFIRNRLSAPIALEDLARVAGVSPRTLHVLCHRQRGVSPMELLRNLRLDAARQRLLSGDLVSVTEVAFEYGFGHLGRFSSYYQMRFGELPRQTLASRH